MSLIPGMRLGPYEIRAPLGSGGMGKVFRASDVRLDREVAVKVLPDDVAGDQKALARFEAEAKAVAALSHPNILTLYDVGAESGVRFVVTELLEGQTLRLLLSGGALAPKRALDVASSIARGLSAAHEKGIVHRDLKPENVFVTKDGHVKILDFGLARRTPGRSSGADTKSPTAHLLSESGTVAGTVAYMSPEQARGLTVDHRSDQFALGILLYECLSGVRPFSGETAADTMASIIRDDPVPLAERAPNVADPICWIVGRLLSKDPAGRYQSTLDLVQDLAACREHLSESSTKRNPLRSRIPRRRFVSIAVATAVLLAGSALAVWILRGRAPPMPASRRLEPKRVVVSVFENQTGDPSLSPLGRIASDWITEGLSRLSQVEVVPSTTAHGKSLEFSRLAGSQARQPPQGRQPQLARDLAQWLSEETGAALVVSGSYQLQGDELRVLVRVTNAATGRFTALEPATGPRNTPMTAVEAVRRRVLGVVALQLGERSAGVAGWDTETSQPTYEAYQEYLSGLELRDSFDPAAAARMNRALELDPSFTAPRLALLLFAVNGRDWPGAAGHLAILEGQRSRLGPLERKWLAVYKALVGGRNQEALTAAREAANRTPHDAVANFWLAYVAVLANHPRQTVSALTAPVDWSGYENNKGIRGSVYYANQAEALHLLGEHERELAVTRKGMATRPASMHLRIVEVQALAAMGRLSEVDRVVGEALGLAPAPFSHSQVMVLGALELRAHGHHDAARKLASRLVDWLNAQPPENAKRHGVGAALSRALLLAERWEEVKPHFDALVKEDPSHVLVLGTVGVLAARRGEKSEARRVSETLRLLERPHLHGEQTLARAKIAAQLGEKDRAVELLRDAFAEGVWWEQSLHADLDLEPLRGYPPYEELIRPKG